MSTFENDKRLIEVDFPLKEVSEESVREKNIRHGHISTLHIWWARRPLAASRTTTYAALVPAPKGEKELREKFKFIAELSKWENSLNEKLIEKARKDIREFFGSKAPNVLDCFAGGGSIPLEALRLGCETYALEYNPVAVLILKAVLEYPQKYGKKLVKDVKKWGQWVYEEAKKEIGKFYPEETNSIQKALSDEGGEKYVPVGYIWARTIRCQKPSCGAEIPLIWQTWLVNKRNKKFALKIVPNEEEKKVNFELAKGQEITFDPLKGTTKGGTVICPICNSSLSRKEVKKQFRSGIAQHRMIVVILYNYKRKGKIYRLATEDDVKILEEVRTYLHEKMKILEEKWKINPIPNEPLPTPTGGIYGEDANLYFNFRCILYGNERWGNLFNLRQKLALITFAEKIRDVYEELLKEGSDSEYAKAITTYLAFAFDKFSTENNALTRWNVNSESFAGKPDQDPRLHMRWDYVESNPFSGIAGSYISHVRAITSVLETISTFEPAKETIFGTATKLPYPDNYFDGIFIDPPYYSNYPYADLADFFYVWLKRILGDIYPDLFSTPLSPRAEEIIENYSLLRGMPKNKAIRIINIDVKTKEFFEKNLERAFREIYRVLKENGIITIVYAHTSTESWEALINSLLNSGLIITASWPIHTERKARLVAQKAAALASSIYMVCRKRVKEGIAYFNEIKEKIRQRVREKLTQFWEQGISGADFFVSAIGPAVEVFGQYSRVEKLSGEEVSVKELLEYIRKVVSEFALERVLKRADLGGVDTQTRFYLLWRWTFGNARVHFDDAIKLSRPLGVELTDLWDKGGLVKKEEEFVKVLNPKERAQDEAFLKKTKFTSMIDILHYVLILWEKGEREKIKEILSKTGYARNEIFWQTAQALSEILPEGDKEKQLIQGFLYGKEDYIKGARDRKLLEFMGDKS